MKTTKYLDGLKNPHEEKIFKTFASEIKVVDDTKRTLTVTISTPNEDRSGDTMNMKGMKYSNFIKNPVVLFAHNYSSKPIAKCLSLQITDKAAIATVEFTPKGLYEEADIIYEMYKQAFLSAWSIGFRALDYDVNKTGGYDFNSWELFEFSSVPVPDNPEALTIMRSKGINVDKVLEKQEETKGEEEENTEEGEKVEEKTEEKAIAPEKEETEEIKKEVTKNGEEEAKAIETKDADDPADDMKITELTVGQLKDILEDVIEAGDTDDDEGKAAAQIVKKDVQEVIALGYVLDTLSWFISCFEMNEVSQSSIDKLTQALGLVMQVVAEQAELGKKEFNLADFPDTKESVKIVAKAGRSISSKHEGMLKDACEHMTKATEKVQTVLDTVAQQEDDEKKIEVVETKEEKEITPETPKEDLLKRIANSLKTNNQQQAALIRHEKETKSLTEKLLEEIRLKGGEK